MSFSNWDAIGAIAEILSALAVLATLIYLARQVRQSNVLARRSEFNMMQEQISRYRLSVAQDEAFASLVMRGSEDYGALSPSEKFRFDHVMGERLWNWHQVWDRSEVGLIERAAWEGLRVQVLGQLAQRGVADWWRIHRRDFPPRFVDDLDKQDR